MWYISRIFLEFIGAEAIPKHEFISYDPRSSREALTVELTFKNTETGEELTLPDNVGTYVVDDFIAEHNPLGVVPISQPDLKFPLRGYVAVSDLSLRFLDCVESVEYMELTCEDELYHTLVEQGIRGRCEVISRSSSGIVSAYAVDFYSLMRDIMCTLFEYICYLPCGWVDDRYYMYAGEAATGGDVITKVYEVKFKDVSRARALIAKAALFNLNPIRDIVEQEI